MNLSVNWIKQYVDLSTVDLSVLAKKLTDLGLEVEHVTTLASGTNLVIGYVESKTKHPTADKLNVCSVRIDENTVTQIVCGAPNVDAGQKVIVALPGAVLPNDFKIKASVIRDIESNGMICSLSELGYPTTYLTEEQLSGIEVLNSDAPLGHKDPLGYLEMDDVILDISLTPNRADCLSMYALAHEVATAYKQTIKELDTQVKVTGTTTIQPMIETKSSPAMGLRVVENITIKESPQWLKRYLHAVGIKSINNIVDLSNYIMIETGQPIHMYDLDQLSTSPLCVSEGFTSTLQLLDGSSIELNESDLVITQDNHPLGLAGVMGGESSKITNDTKRILIEAAIFNPVNIRNTAKRHNLMTDAAMRFMKGSMSLGQIEYVLDRIANRIQTMDDACVVSPITVIKTEEVEQNKIELSTQDVKRTLGIELSEKQIDDILNQLLFTFEVQGDKRIITVPNHRHDLMIKEDLVEEIIRVHGYDHIPSTLPVVDSQHYGLTSSQKRKRQVKQLMRSFGLDEVVTYTLTKPEYVHDFTNETKEPLKLMSPLSVDRSVVRQSVIPSLLEVIQYHQARQMKNVSIFEVSNTYDKDQETLKLGIAITGVLREARFLAFKEMIDFYHVKAMIEQLLVTLGFDVSRYQIKPVSEDETSYHPGQSAHLYFSKTCVGTFGLIHPLMAKKYDVKKVFVGEIDLGHLLKQPSKQIKFKPVSQYPIVYRDLSLVVNKQTTAQAIEKVIKGVGKQLIQSIEVFDVYQREGNEGSSVAINIGFQDPTHTLTSEEVDACVGQILESLNKELDVTLRS